MKLSIARVLAVAALTCTLFVPGSLCARADVAAGGARPPIPPACTIVSSTSTATTYSNGTIVYADGTLVTSDGTIYYPNGTVGHK